MASEEVFQPNRGERGGINDILILLTDGGSNVNASQTVANAQALKQSGTSIYVVAMGDQVNMEEVNAIATEANEKYVLTVNAADDVVTSSENLLNFLCL